MPSFAVRPFAALLVAGVVGFGVAACGNEASQGNDGGDPVGVTSPTPTATAEGTGATQAIPPQATAGTGEVDTTPAPLGTTDPGQRVDTTDGGSQTSP